MTLSTNIVVLPITSNTLEIREVEIPDPGPHQVVVELYASGVCHTQLHTIHRPRSQPMLLGHEATGVVVGTGGEVDHVAPGDMVLLTWMRRQGTPTTRHPQFASVALEDGTVARGTSIFTWAEHTIVDEQYVVKVDENTDKHLSSIIGCAVMTGAGAVENTAALTNKQSVAIFGAGGVGVPAIVAAANIGAYPIIAVDVDNTKLEFAKQFGATHGVNALEGDPVEAIRKITQSEVGLDPVGQPVCGADVVVDCVATPRTLEQAVAASKTGQFGVEKGGTTVIVGAANEGANWVMNEIMKHERMIIGSHGGSCVPDRDFGRYVEWHQEGRLDLNHMVTRQYKLAEVNEAVAALEAGEISGRAIIVFD